MVCACRPYQKNDGGLIRVRQGGATSAQSATAGGSSAPAGPPHDLSAAQHLIDKINAKHDVQSAFVNAPKPDPKALEFWRKVAEGIGNILTALGKLFAPLAPAMPWLAGLLVLAVIALLLSPLVRMMITTRFERLFRGNNLQPEVPWRPSRQAVAALLHEIDALAEKGEYDEAVHLLLVRSVADINAFRPDLVRLHTSARDILSHPLLPKGARPAFARIVHWVEKSYFAGIKVGKAGFDACRQAYVDFAAAEGVA